MNYLFNVSISFTPVLETFWFLCKQDKKNVRTIYNNIYFIDEKALFSINKLMIPNKSPLYTKL